MSKESSGGSEQMRLGLSLDKHAGPDQAETPMCHRRADLVPVLFPTSQKNRPGPAYIAAGLVEIRSSDQASPPER